MKLSRLIEENLFQISLTIFFSTLAALIPLIYQNTLPNFQLNMLSLRCLILNFLTGLASWFFYRKDSKVLTFPIIGIISSAGYLKSGSFWIMPFCISLTITSVSIVALIAFSSIKVKF
jgi:hypothetical protein